MRRTMYAVPALAGLIAAAALTIPQGARAWTSQDLPSLGYSVSVITLGSGCKLWSATGYGQSANLGSDCDADFQDRVDAFVKASCPCAQTVPTTTAAPPVTTAPPTVTDTTPVPVTTAATGSAPAPTTTAAAPTVTVTTVIVDPTVNARLDLLEQKQATDEARIYALEHPVAGQILGEPKNVAPFVAVV